MIRVGSLRCLHAFRVSVLNFLLLLILPLVAMLGGWAVLSAAS
ncbi:hypothetical protein [Synechococcus sp. MIT S9503]